VVTALFMASCDVSASQNSESSNGGSDMRTDTAKWVSTQSQDGHFTVDLPCVIDRQGPSASYRTNVEIKQYALGCRRADGVAFSAVRISYSDAAAGQNDFDRFTRPIRKGDAPAKLLSYEGFQGIEHASQSYSEVCEHLRIVRVKNDNFLLGLQSLNNRICETYTADSQRFFGSLKVSWK
jgi:hypothetical protein